ncbi:NAD-dependent epimerase/dehydratase family protein [Hippea maritima]|uniref:NAD-dependent epimerase/dehydratase n=1 Tax=Hippea maritima (strain ATCC 700847 / DSM 10411 / MH2) TaxID=760142 RepID=F2LVJ0_HIPMA|nr:NAD(P)-dependent oxidoreductase [Hippea maritima]AEA33774.1 NAD-dependent epimerase/dehydratase [Hippea maritima DSM 10411]
MRVFVSGATGFVGVNTVKKLIKYGHEVVAFVRNKGLAEKLLDRQVDVFQGSIEDFDTVYSGLKGCDAVIHIAGQIKAHNLDDLYTTNRIGSRNVAVASRRLNINNVVYVSSLAARGPDGAGSVVSHYGYSKRLGELEFIHNLFDANLKIIRPPIVYGPFDKGLLELFRMARLGVLPKMDKYYSFIFIDDLVEAIVKLINLDFDSPRIYCISSGKYHCKEINQALLRAAGKNGAFYLPLNDKIAMAGLLFSTSKSPFSRDKIREIKPKAWTCDSERLNKDIKFSPTIDIFTGFDITFRWYEEHGWI